MSKKILIILASAVLAIGIIGAGGFLYMRQNGAESENGLDVKAGEHMEQEELDKNRINFPLEGFIVNLADPGGKRYLSTKMVLEFNDKKHIPLLEKRVPEMRDRILMILPTKTFKDIQSVEGKNALRTTLIAALNELLPEGKITNIYFQEFVIQ